MPFLVLLWGFLHVKEIAQKENINHYDKRVVSSHFLLVVQEFLPSNKY